MLEHDVGFSEVVKGGTECENVSASGGRVQILQSLEQKCHTVANWNHPGVKGWQNVIFYECCTAFSIAVHLLF